MNNALAEDRPVYPLPYKAVGPLTGRELAEIPDQSYQGPKCLDHVQRLYPKLYIDTINRYYIPKISETMTQYGISAWQAASLLYSQSKNNFDKIFFCAAAEFLG